jgi:gliding-associated putative ABC transporter substrate-binding component GldG
MKNKLYITTLLVVAIVLIVNLISQDLFVRLDFTEGGQYTLSKATKNLLKNLEEPVTVKAYYSENLPPDVAKGKKDMKELLIEYSNISKGNLVYEFVNPGEDEKTERDAMQAGVQPVMINVREKDQVKQQKAFMGLVVSIGDRKETIPFIQPGGALEYTLSTAIKKVSIQDKPVVGLLQGHGEPGIGEMPQAYQELTVLYNVEPLTLTDSTTIPDRIKTIMVIRPEDSIPAKHLAQLDRFLERGGKMLVALNRVKADLQYGYGSVKNIGLESWLKAKGIVVDDNVVIDARCASVQVQQQQGAFRMISSMQFPYIPVVSKFAAHPISGGLEGLVMQFVSPVGYTGDSTVKYTPIAFTSEKSGTEKAPIYINIQRQWTQADFPQKNLVVAALFEGKLAGSTPTKMVVVGDGDFAINGSGQQAQQLQPDNVNFLVNSIDYLSDETGLIDLRTKSVTSRPLDEVSDGKKAFLKWFNFLLPILLILGYGFLRSQVNRNKRIQRMEESYV